MSHDSTVSHPYCICRGWAVLRRLCAGTLVLAAAACCMPAYAQSAADSQSPHYPRLVWRDVVKPYDGPINKGVDSSTLYGKVMCGYQGWFSMPDDGADFGVVHWGPVLDNPARATFDFWPDMSELTPQEKFPTNYKLADGSAAYLYSAVVKQTVLRHFKWMQDYGIDGVFVQRFGSSFSDTKRALRSNAVLANCREGANRYGRTFAIMYDVSFDRPSCERIMKDWSQLVHEMKLLDTPAYQRHKAAPVVALWGYGFSGRTLDHDACEQLFRFLKAPENGGCKILLGVENNWRSWAEGKTERDRTLHELMAKYCDIIQPWNVGRYNSPATAADHFAKWVPEDIKWCNANGKDYYSVIFPGFSWTNLRKGEKPINQIPRLGGRFLWSQAEQVNKYGMNMVYVAMFDEVDEGTAIFKCTNNPPVGRFCTYEGLPSDHYLRLTGLIGRMLRGEKVAFPEVKPDPAQMTYRPLSTQEYYGQ